MPSYLDALRSGKVEEPAYYESAYDYRKDKTPAEVAKEARGQATRSGMYEMQMQPVLDIQARLVSTPGQTIEVVKSFGHVVSGMDAYVDFLLALKGAKSARFRGRRNTLASGSIGYRPGNAYVWKVSSVSFPKPPPPGGF